MFLLQLAIWNWTFRVVFQLNQLVESGDTYHAMQQFLQMIMSWMALFRSCFVRISGKTWVKTVIGKKSHNKFWALHYKKRALHYKKQAFRCKCKKYVFYYQKEITIFDASWREILSFEFWIFSFRFQVSGFRFQVSSFKCIFNFQLSIFNFQLSTFNFQLSTFNFQLSTH